MAHRRDDYHQALGEFISEFAFVEHLVFNLLRKEAAVSDEVAKAVFSGVRIDTARDFISRVHEARGTEKSAFLVRAFEQIGVITRIRNDIVHYGFAAERDGEFIVSNWRVAHTARALRTHDIAPEVLRDMRMDLMQIGVALLIETNPDLYRDTRDEAVAFVSQPWRYKPASQSPRTSERQQRPPKQQRPPRSSPA